MIGQEHLREMVDKLVPCLPGFIVIVGPKGSGKKTLAQYIASQFDGITYTTSDVKIATIRDIITNSYKVVSPTLYIVPDIDTMSKAAQNSILKITEEPPNRAIFVMTVSDINTVLPTIKSRAYTMFMDVYSAKELREYLAEIQQDEIEWTKGAEICETPGELNTYFACGGEVFTRFVDKVVENVGKVSLANALKILDSLATKEEGKGYDVNLFLKIFMKKCVTHAFTTVEDNAELYIEMIIPTSKCLKALAVQGANKQMLLTDWIFKVRDIWI